MQRNNLEVNTLLQLGTNMGHKLEPQKLTCLAWKSRNQRAPVSPFKGGAAQWAGQDLLQASTQDWPWAAMNLNLPFNSYHGALPGLSTSFDTPFHGAGNLI